MTPDFEIDWIDRRRHSRVTSNPAYPAGVDVHMVEGPGPTCSTILSYPARRCGVYVVRCRVCGMTTGVTTAGRLDDPRSLTVSCDRREH